MHEPPPNLPPDKMLANGRYELKEVLGSGGMAHVYRARDHQLDVDRAIKVIRTEGRVSKTRHRRLKVEARAMARVRHPHILTIYDVGETEFGPFVVMDVALGGALDTKLAENGPLPPLQAMTWMAQILEGLDAAHAEGVVHRDVKPSNILLDESGNALLADFGIAMLSDDLERHTRTGVTMGSVSYMAPEQRLDARGVDATADVYAAGCTLYNLLTMATPVDLFTAHEGSPRWDDVPLALRPILYRATRLEPESRFATAGEFASTIRQAMPFVESGEAVPDGLLPNRLDRGRVVPEAEVVLEMTTMDPDVTVDRGLIATTSGWLERTFGLDLSVYTPNQKAAFAGALVGIAAVVALIVWSTLRPPANRILVTPTPTPSVAMIAKTPTPAAPVETPVPVETPAVVETPVPTATPTPRATPRRTPKPTPRATPKPTPKPTPTPKPVPDAPLEVAGSWGGNLGPTPVVVKFSGPPSRVRGTVTADLGGAKVVTSVKGAFDNDSRTLRLEDLEDVADAGIYTLRLTSDGTRLKGEFNRKDGMGMVTISLKRR